jgi:RNA polymerase sigma factor (sigma-70 family)
MANPPLLSVLRYVRTLAGAAASDEQTDGQLLQQFVAHRDEAAFARLLRRHGPLVLGVCRQVLGDLHAAEDAFQATFLVLARKAGSIRRIDSLAPWLYRVALNVARTAKLRAVQRRAHERQAAAMVPTSSVEESPLRDWQPLLHEEIDRLPEKYRVPVVLCYLEGRTHAEAARRLGWPIGTVKGRLARARDLLGPRLARRGLTLSAAGVAVLLAASSAQAAIPPTLAAATLQAAMRFTAGPKAAATAASAATVLLANQALKTAALSRLLIGLALLSAALATAGGLLALGARTEPPVGHRLAVEAGKHPGPEPGPPSIRAVPGVRPRIVFVGDSSTDGNTYLLLIQQALARAGRPVPACINAGVSLDTVRGIRERLERDVFVHRPTLVAFSAGIGDAIQKVPASTADYEADVRAIAAQVRAKGVPLLLLTTSLVGPGWATAETRLADYNAVLRRLAREFSCRVADVNRLMREARDAGRAVVEVAEGDNFNPNYEGHRLIARVVLDALGHRDVPVPKQLAIGPMPGILTEWRVRVNPAGQTPLDERLIAKLDPDSSDWTAYALPEERPAATWWLDQERKRGFALSLDQRLGEAKAYQGVAYLHAERPKAVFLLTGADLHSVWLNGQRVYRSDGWTGWHAGKERVPVRLRPGRNVFVIESGRTFFLSVTDRPETPEEGP